MWRASELDGRPNRFGSIGRESTPCSAATAVAAERSLFGVEFRGAGVGSDDGGGDEHGDEGEGEKKVMHGGVLLGWGRQQPLT